jgi:hypothetical protein
MLTAGQIDYFRTFGFVVLRGFLSDRAGVLRAETDAAIREAYAATYDQRVVDEHPLPDGFGVGTAVRRRAGSAWQRSCPCAGAP